MPNPKGRQPKPKSKTGHDDCNQQIGELTVHLQKLQAEFENYKKRETAARTELLDAAKISILAELLPALDNFDRAATHLPRELENNSWAQGMQYVGTQLEQIFEDIGIKKFDPVGHEFDHTEHEAVEYSPADKPAGLVVETIIPGYMIGEKIIRPAQVKVSSGSDHHHFGETGPSDENNESRNNLEENNVKGEK